MTPTPKARLLALADEMETWAGGLTQNRIAIWEFVDRIRTLAESLADGDAEDAAGNYIDVSPGLFPSSPYIAKGREVIAYGRYVRSINTARQSPGEGT